MRVSWLVGSIFGVQIQVQVFGGRNKFSTKQLNANVNEHWLLLALVVVLSNFAKYTTKTTSSPLITSH